MTRAQAIAYLTREGNLRVPFSRYGSDSLECAAVAWRVHKNLLWHTGELNAPEEVALDHLMRMVVNDHDDIAYTLKEYKIPRKRRSQ